MRKPFDKKRFWLIVAVLIVVEVLVICLAMRWKYLFPSGEVSDVYKRYQDAKGVDVTFIRDFQVNDTVFVDVTVLEATDSAGWAVLKHDFAVPELNTELKTHIENSKNLIFSRRLTPDNYPIDIPSGTIIYDMLAISYYSHTLSVYHSTSDAERYAVLYHNIDESIKQ